MSCTSIIAAALARKRDSKVRADVALENAFLGSMPAEAERVFDLLACAAHFAATEHAASMSADGGDVSRDPSVRRDLDALLTACRRFHHGA